MSSDQPEVPESRPSVRTSNETPESDDEKAHGHVAVDDTLLSGQVRAIVRLVQCRQCSLPLCDPVTLPCGRSLCRQCLPESRAREHISYPATLGRLQGFDCPFPECDKTHALGDCGADVILGKAVSHFRKEINRGKCAGNGTKEPSTREFTHDQRTATGEPAMAEGGDTSHVLRAGSLIATYTMAETGDLDYDVNKSFTITASTETGTESRGKVSKLDQTVYHKIKETVRSEMDCQVCYAIFYDPLTTVCGHTFCRSCLHRVLDHAMLCPICRSGLSAGPLLDQQSCPSNEYLSCIINTFWPDVVLARGDALAAEASNRHREFDIPLFVCTLSFPVMPTFLHVFEPRYRLLTRRAMEGDGTFGMVLPRRARSSEDANFKDHGTLLRIVNAEYFADGRSMIETQGISRFKVLRHGTLDGYTVAKIERIDDVSIAEEEDVEARETQTVSTNSAPSATATASPTTREDLERMSTRELLDFVVAFVDRMHRQSVPWLAQRILTIYGECPQDAAHFPWWFASILPAKDGEKYKLLETTSVRGRLKICCGWIIDWELSRWYPLADCRIF